MRHVWNDYLSNRKILTQSCITFINRVFKLKTPSKIKKSTTQRNCFHEEQDILINGCKTVKYFFIHFQAH